MKESIRFKDYLKDYLEIYDITNKDFAQRINISPKHLSEILSGEMDLSSNVIEKISFVTNIKIEDIYKIENNYKKEKEINNYLEKENLTISKYLQKFKYTELIKKEYIDFTNKENKITIVKDILKFLRISEIKDIDNISNQIYFKSTNDKKEILLIWLEKCYRKSLEQEVSEYKKENIDKLVSYIRKNAINNIFNEELLIKEFNKNGIALVIEEEITGTKVRGAFKVNRNKPVIYLSYRHKRISDIYFALLHELAHCKTDFNKAKQKSLVSIDDEDIEEKADKQAFVWMINNKDYEKYLNNSVNLNELNNLLKLEVNNPKSFIVYRLAKDRKINYSSNIYQHYNNIIKNTKI